MGNLARQLGPQVIGVLYLANGGDRLVENKIATGRKMRVDTTVVETDNVHYPTDSSLLGDGGCACYDAHQEESHCRGGQAWHATARPQPVRTN